jgi:hypothetical protein
LDILTALFDACVLYPQTLRDLLLNLARTDLFCARWTDLINEEWTPGAFDAIRDSTRTELSEAPPSDSATALTEIAVSV